MDQMLFFLASVGTLTYMCEHTHTTCMHNLSLKTKTKTGLFWFLFCFVFTRKTREGVWSEVDRGVEVIRKNKGLMTNLHQVGWDICSMCAVKQGFVYGENSCPAD